MDTSLTADEVLALGKLHAEREAAQDLAGVMATLNDDPFYEYPMIGKRFFGRENTQRFYRWFFANFSPHVVDGRLIGEWANHNSVAQEYDITLSFDGERETHRVLGVLLVAGDRLCGERVYATEAAVRRMIGPLFDELYAI